MNATCETCPFWQRALQTKFLNDPDPITGEPVSDGKEPSKYGYCHLASVQSPSADDFKPNEEWWCSEHPLRQRDRLAAMAMQGILACPEGDDASFEGELVARNAYRMADAMLKARGEEPTP